MKGAGWEDWNCAVAMDAGEFAGAAAWNAVADFGIVAENAGANAAAWKAANAVGDSRNSEAR